MNAPCPLCRASVTWARTSKGAPSAIERDDAAGYIYLEEGFTHVYGDHDHAMRRDPDGGGMDQAVIDYFDGRPPLYVEHFCDSAGLAA